MKCICLQSFAGLIYSGAKGKEINLPIDEARSLESAGIVKIIADYVPEVAYETAEAAKKGRETKVIKPKRRG